MQGSFVHAAVCMRVCTANAQGGANSCSLKAVSQHGNSPFPAPKQTLAPVHTQKQSNKDSSDESSSSEEVATHPVTRPWRQTADLARRRQSSPAMTTSMLFAKETETSFKESPLQASSSTPRLQEDTSWLQVGTWRSMAGAAWLCVETMRAVPLSLNA